MIYFWRVWLFLRIVWRPIDGGRMSVNVAWELAKIIWSKEPAPVE